MVWTKPKTVGLRYYQHINEIIKIFLNIQVKNGFGMYWCEFGTGDRETIAALKNWQINLHVGRIWLYLTIIIYMIYQNESENWVCFLQKDLLVIVTSFVLSNHLIHFFEILTVYAEKLGGSFTPSSWWSLKVSWYCWNYLECVKPYEYWDIYYINSCRISSVNSRLVFGILQTFVKSLSFKHSHEKTHDVFKIS